MNENKCLLLCIWVGSCHSLASKWVQFITVSCKLHKHRSGHDSKRTVPTYKSLTEPWTELCSMMPIAVNGKWMSRSLLMWKRCGQQCIFLSYVLYIISYVYTNRVLSFHFKFRNTEFIVSTDLCEINRGSKFAASSLAQCVWLGLYETVVISGLRTSESQMRAMTSC